MNVKPEKLIWEHEAIPRFEAVMTVVKKENM